MDKELLLKLLYGGALGSMPAISTAINNNNNEDRLSQLLAIRKGREDSMPNRIVNPDETLAKTQIDQNRAESKLENSVGWQLFNGLGQAALQTGLSMAGDNKNMFAAGGQIVGEYNTQNNVADNIMQAIMRNGNPEGVSLSGAVPQVAEVEGGEAIERQNGDLEMMEGPSHSEGGIDTLLNPATNTQPGDRVYTDRLSVGEGKDKKSLAKRKEAREKKLASLYKKLEKNPTDQLLKDTIERLEQQIEAEDNRDWALQEAFRNIYEGEVPTKENTEPEQFALGGTPIDPKKIFSDVNQIDDLFAQYQKILEDNKGMDPTLSGEAAAAILSTNNPNAFKSHYGDVANFLSSYKPQPVDTQLGSMTAFNPYAMDMNTGLPVGQDVAPISPLNKDNSNTDLDSFPEIGSPASLSPEQKALGEIEAPLINLDGTPNEDINSNDPKKKATIGDLLTGSAGMPTFGDLVGMYGNISKGRSAMQNALRQRALDTPNKNHFEDVGKQARKDMQNAKDAISKSTARNLLEAEASNKAVRNSVANTTSSNVNRAMKIASQSQFNDLVAKLTGQEQSVLANLDATMAQLGQQADVYSAQGDAIRADNDVKDRDNFFSQLAKAQQLRGDSNVATGKAMNQIKARGVNENFLNNLVNFTKADVMTGNINTTSDIPIGSKNTTDNKSGVDDTKPKNSEKEIIKNIPDSAWNNMKNPETGETFKSAEEYYNVMKDRVNNPYFDALEEADIRYKDLIDPNSKTGLPFKSFSDFSQYMATGKSVEDLKPYSPAQNVSTNIIKGIDEKEVEMEINTFLKKNNFAPIDLSIKENVKALQKALGLSPKHITGNIGKITLEALKKHNK